MSFILDALKKSENDRQRQSGPALFEVRVAPPRPRFPPWAIAVAGLLVVNVGIIGWLMMRKPAVAAPQSQAAPAPTAAATPPAQTAPPPLYYQPAPPAGAPPQGYAPPQQQYAPPGAPPPGYPQPQPQYSAPPQAPNYAPQPAADPRLAETRPPSESANPDDYAPATESRDTSMSLSGRVRRGTESGLPTYDEAVSKIGVPPLRLDLHVYAPDPHKRFIMLNMKRLGEGDSLQEGVKVESITNDGAILSYHGSQFVMERD